MWEPEKVKQFIRTKKIKTTDANNRFKNLNVKQSRETTIVPRDIFPRACDVTVHIDIFLGFITQICFINRLELALLLLLSVGYHWQENGCRKTCINLLTARRCAITEIARIFGVRLTIATNFVKLIWIKRK